MRHAVLSGGTVPTWRAGLWGTLAALFLLPLLAMQLTPEVAWTGQDFVAAALLLPATGLGIELVVRVTRSRRVRGIGSALVLAAAALIWAEGAVQVF